MIKSISLLLFSECLVLVIVIVAMVNVTVPQPPTQHLAIAIHTVNVRGDTDLQIVQLLVQAGVLTDTSSTPHHHHHPVRDKRSYTTFFCYLKPRRCFPGTFSRSCS